jgi:leader peptidase (prepilin peptidase) / N-methyltransferase
MIELHLEVMPHWLSLALRGMAFSGLGSFMGVCVHRTDPWSILFGRSACRSCETRIPLYAIIPIFSWLWLRGRCGKCGAKLSIAYLWLEIGSVLAWAAGEVCGQTMLQKVAIGVLGSVLVGIAVIDQWEDTVRRWFLIPLALLALALALAAPQPEAGLADALLGAALAAAAAGLVRLLAVRFTGKASPRAGEILLMSVAGMWAGWQGLPHLVGWTALALLASRVVAAATAGRFPPRRGYSPLWGLSAGWFLASLSLAWAG